MFLFHPVYLCHKYPGLSVKRAAKSWRHPLRKPTARAVPTAVKHQAASDDGRIRHTHMHAQSSRRLLLLFLIFFQHFSTFYLLSYLLNYRELIYLKISWASFEILIYRDLFYLSAETCCFLWKLRKLSMQMNWLQIPLNSFIKMLHFMLCCFDAPVAEQRAEQTTKETIFHSE